MIPARTIDNIKIVAEKHNLPFDILAAIVEKESNGVFFWGTVPIFRPEGHHFYKYLSGAKRTQAVKQGLAAAKMGVVKVPGRTESRIAMLNRMIDIDREAALLSISMGVGQVMGFNAKTLGFKSATEMWNVAHSEAGQIEILSRFIEASPALRTAVRKRDYQNIGRIYNGPKHAMNNYARDIERYSLRYRGSKVTVPGPNQTQQYVDKIVGLGYSTVREFQQKNSLKVDGIIGPATMQKVQEIIDAIDQTAKEAEKPAEKVVAGGAVVAGTGGIIAAAESVTSVSAAVRPAIDAIVSFAAYGWPVLVVLGVAAVAFGVVYLVRKRRERKLVLEGVANG